MIATKSGRQAGERGSKMGEKMGHETESVTELTEENRIRKSVRSGKCLTLRSGKCLTLRSQANTEVAAGCEESDGHETPGKSITGREGE